MGYSRTTSTGRRVTAVPRVREEPDMKSLVALVLHLAEELHAEEQARHPAGHTSEDEKGNNDDAAIADTA